MGQDVDLSGTLETLLADSGEGVRNWVGEKRRFDFNSHKFAISKIIRGHQIFRPGYKLFFGIAADDRGNFDKEGVVEGGYKYREISNITAGSLLTIHSHARYGKDRKNLGSFAVVNWDIRREESWDMNVRNISIVPVLKVIQFDYVDIENDSQKPLENKSFQNEDIISVTNLNEKVVPVETMHEFKLEKKTYPEEAKASERDLLFFFFF
jgi:hypothetical protein